MIARRAQRSLAPNRSAGKNAPLGKNDNAEEIAFTLAAQPSIASRKSACWYGELASGAYQDRETGLWYNYRRDCYDPALGRFCQSDPIGLDGRSLLTYGYAAANPLSNTDPDGTIIVPVVVGAVAFVVGTTAGVKISEIGIGEVLKAQNRRQVEELKQLQENILLPACFNGSQAACNEIVRLDQLKQQCYGSTVNLSAPQSNASSGGLPTQVGKSILRFFGLGR